MGASATEQSYSSSKDIQCDNGWWENPSSKDFSRCNELTETETARFLQQKMEIATTPPVPTPLPTITPGFDPIEGTDPVTIPIASQQVKEIDTTELADGPSLLRGCNSVWQLGSVLLADGYRFSPLLLLARPPQGDNYASLTLLPSRFESENLLERYGEYWEAPQEVGIITITNVSSVIITEEKVEGIVSFTTSQGQTGTFNLTTEEWEFGH